MSYTVTVNPSGGFAAAVGLSASGLPSGASASFSPTSTTTTSTLTVSTTSAVAAGSYPFTITGTSGSLTHTTSATLVVQSGAPAGDFSLSASPASQTAPSGFKSVTYTITIVRGSGFSRLVTLSTGPLPAGFRAVFSPNPTPSTAKLILTGNGGHSTPSTITITGIGGGHSHTTSVILIH